MTKRDNPFITHRVRTIFFTIAASGILLVSLILIWITTLDLPNFDSFDERKTAQSTKIYDRTGEVLLYDVHQNFKRTVIPFEEMGEAIKEATVAIEDKDFYTHPGIRITSIIRAVLVNIFQGDFTQGGSTITQQVIKNTLLTKEKTVTRKLKEWILAVKLEQVTTKDEILAIYLNESPYGGSVYGIEEASKTFFEKSPIDLTIAEAAYLAAIPQAPTYFSPYGSHVDKLKARKDLVLSKMYELGFITSEEYETSKKEEVVFTSVERTGIKAPHFVFFVREYLEKTYGQEMVENGGLKVITTLNYELQEQAEEIVKRHALKNEIDWNASNAGMVAIDPTTGEILVMVGSRDYFDTAIDGNFNIATARRQPGSSFKPFVYATAFSEGYPEKTILFDVKTEFQGGCNAYGIALPGHSQASCYSPNNYDGKYLGPINLRTSLAQSRNVTSVKLLYLAGVNDSIATARNMGITSLIDEETYGLTLVLGGGEVSLLDMTSAYGVFAANGERHPYMGILTIEDPKGVMLEKFESTSSVGVDVNSALMISDILSDNVARTPLFGSNSFMNFPGYDVAAKTGTTNSNKDAWLLGYTPTIALGVWSGNNDNTPMKKGSSISGPMWHEFMQILLQEIPQKKFDAPTPESDSVDVKPVLRGEWLGGESFIIDTISGKLATELTPIETQKEIIVTDVHNILYWVDKDNPKGPVPINPSNDPQFTRWEQAVIDWWNTHKGEYSVVDEDEIPTDYDDIHVKKNMPEITIAEPNSDDSFNKNDTVSVEIEYEGKYSLQKFDVFIDDVYLGTKSNKPFTYSFISDDFGIDDGVHILKVVAYDEIFNRVESTQTLVIE